MLRDGREHQKIHQKQLIFINHNVNSWRITIMYSIFFDKIQYKVKLTFYLNQLTKKKKIIIYKY